MVYISSRNMQAINMLSSSWATVLLTIGIIVDEWVELIPKRQKIKVNHSPWMTCCITTWPEGELERIRMMMVAVLGISFSLNLILGLEFTYVIPQNIYIYTSSLPPKVSSQGNYSYIHLCLATASLQGKAW
nr:transmembrane protein 225 isoform X1 [Oryctolagus cuniculus]